MNKEYEYAFIPIIALEILTFFWLILAFSYYIVRLKYKTKKLELSIKEFNFNHLKTLNEKCSIKYQKMIFKKYKYSQKKSLLKINRKIENSKSILDLLIGIKMLNDVRLENTTYNGERLIFNISNILKIVRYVFILPFIFNLLALLFFLIAITTKNNNNIIVYSNLIKSFALLSLTLFLFLWFVWAYNYDRYIKEIELDIYTFFNEEEMKIIKFLLKFNYLIIGIK